MQLSGGQQQRVAIARSLVNDPYFVLADEATGNLDSETTDEILALFERLNDAGKTIIMVTHEHDVARHAKRIVRLRDGYLQSDEHQHRSRHVQSVGRGVASKRAPLRVAAKRSIPLSSHIHSAFPSMYLFSLRTWQLGVKACCCTRCARC